MNPLTIDFYTIRTLTNMHVGSGDNNYGVIDRQVQRDVNSELPTINASSLKGALRQFVNHHDNSLVDSIFGSAAQAGGWQFLSADLLSRPARSNMVPFFNATSPSQIRGLLDKFISFNITLPEALVHLSQVEPQPGEPIVFSQEFEAAMVEEHSWIARYEKPSFDLNDLTPLFGNRPVLLHDQDFKQLDLPVVARNYLENGESKNLWYEEVVPYDARFGFFIICNQQSSKPFLELLEQPVQIGGNASVGYGLCSIQNQIRQSA